MGIKPKGGRGKQAPYKTKIMRVPLPLVNQFEEEINKFRNIVINGSDNQEDYVNDNVVKLDTNQISRDEAIEKAKAILKNKKGAKQSLIKLLQVIYNDKLIKAENLS